MGEDSWRSDKWGWATSLKEKCAWADEVLVELEVSFAVYGLGAGAEWVYQQWLDQMAPPIVGILLLSLAFLLGAADCYASHSCKKYVGLASWLGHLITRPFLTPPLLWLIGWLGLLHYIIKLL